jgi:Flp pilus assembly protein TadD
MQRYFGLSIALGLGVLTAVTCLAAPTASDLRSQGLIYRDQERYPDAIAALEQSLKLDPQSVSGHVLLGWTHHKAKQEPEAAQALLGAIALEPNHVPAWNALGIVYLVSHDLSATVAVHGWAAWLKPDNEIAYYNLSLALEGLREYTWAEWAAQQAVPLEPDNPHPWVAIAIAQWGAGLSAQAHTSFRQAIQLDGRYQDADFLNYLDEAGFSPTQIQTAQQILKTLQSPA